MGLLKPNQGGELAANVIESCSGNRAARVADRACERVDAAHMAGQDLSGDGQPRRQHDAGAKRANTRCDRADDRELGHAAEIGRRNNQRRVAATALLRSDAGIEIGPDEVARLGNVAPRPIR